MSIISSYKLEDIRNKFSKHDYNRGLDYVIEGRVKSIVFDGDSKIKATVQGNKIYKVEASFQIKNNNKQIYGSCSCPVGLGCKHIAATLLQTLEKLSSLSKEPANYPVIKTQVLDPEVTHWLKSLETQEEIEPIKHDKIIVYIIQPPKKQEAFNVSAIVTSILKNGNFGKNRRYFDIQNTRYSRPKYLQDIDLDILNLIYAINNNYYNYDNDYTIPAGKFANLLLESLIKTGRCFTSFNFYLPDNCLKFSMPRQGNIEWKVNGDGSQRLELKVKEMNSPEFLALEPPYYMCSNSNIIGPLEIPLLPKQASALLKAPPVKPEQVATVSKQISSILGDIPDSWKPSEIPVNIVNIKPVPCINLTSATIQAQKVSAWSVSPFGEPINIAAASISFNYDGKELSYQDNETEIRQLRNKEVAVIPRDKKAEKAILDTLPDIALNSKLGDLDSYSYKINSDDKFLVTIRNKNKKWPKEFDTKEEWENFMQITVPKLAKQGWSITMDDDFPHNIVYIEDGWYTNIEENSGIDWFGVELGVNIENEHLNLTPILIGLLKKYGDVDTTIKNCADNKHFIVPIGDGRRIALPSDRAKLLLTIVKQLFTFNDKLFDGKLRFQIQEAALLAEMADAANALDMRWVGGEKLRKMGKKLQNFQEIQNIKVPPLFKGELRHYQQDGLNWLQFLKEYNLAGILADDMGLGKTVQVLAHISTEKASKKLKSPFLVVAPTSLMVNWKMEAERFVPDLKVLVMHGSKRSQHFGTLEQYDLVLTTYPLLLRDKEQLLKCKYHTIILDEAQTIKNSRSKLTQIACQLKAQHRLCMTGTPLENHLGELWSLFNFLLPGYLGTTRQFSEIFRNPIEKNGDIDKAKYLQRRIKPFTMRRTKSEVATELPPKTEILRIVELEGKQRDLYETIRVAMHKKVRDELAANGLEKSHIIVLDALLKLRQVCGDPRLLKIDVANKVTESAKLNELMTLLPSLIEENRKILLFSQFTTMLALIEEELNKAKIPYVILTGQTTDRETPIRNFQEGKVPLFLISLKAGGTGLNLTAADTVIHYDPWWNPAAENQATDRAHRIGQDKPVFVYKLITAGTVEEKILQMQQKKQTLMDNLFNPEAKTNVKLTAGDLQILFESLD